jgi:hypothetical protein
MRELAAAERGKAQSHSSEGKCCRPRAVRQKHWRLADPAAEIG